MALIWKKIISLCFSSIIKQSGTNRLNRYMLAAPIRLEEVHVLRQVKRSAYCDCCNDSILSPTLAAVFGL